MEEKLETKSEITIKRKASPYWICFSIVITILIFITIGILAYLFHSGYFDNIIKQLQPQVNNQYTIPERNSTVNNYINISIDPPGTNVTINNNNININNVTNST